MKKFLIFTFAITLAGCNFLQPTLVPEPTLSEEIFEIEPTRTLEPSNTPQPTFTFTPQPSATPMPVPVSAGGPTATPVPAATDDVNSSTVIVFLVKLSDDGLVGDQIGCGDSLVPVEVAVPPFTNELETAFNALFGFTDHDIGENMTALSQSTLSFVSSSLNGNKLTVYLTGSLSSAGVCDDPRIIGQLKKTAAFAEDLNIEDVSIVIDGRLVEDILSLKGK